MVFDSGQGKSVKCVGYRSMIRHVHTFYLSPCSLCFTSLQYEGFYTSFCSKLFQNYNLITFILENIIKSMLSDDVKSLHVAYDINLFMYRTRYSVYVSVNDLFMSLVYLRVIIALFVC